MKHLYLHFITVLLLFVVSESFSQYFPIKNYPQDYFTYPVINVRKSLSANFGELRANHYHMGLDCRTDQATNKTVVAAADGYVARISVAPWGYGRAIYINHPNGMTTVYGHLNKFFPELQAYLEEQQYEKESWPVDLTLEPEQFPVKKGQHIALSGNTGGSFGPHTHFEIRDTKTEKVFNPLLFNMPIPDKVPPTIVSLYMYDRCKSTYSQKPVRIPLKWTGGKFVATQSVVTIPTYRVSFGVTANDKQSGSTNPNGIYEGRIFFDNEIQSAFQLDSIDYIETRYINAHIDYRTRAAGGSYIQHLSRLPGYPEGVYKDFGSDGVIDLQDREVHPVRIEILDADGNKSTIQFNIKRGFINESPEKNVAQSETEFVPNFVNIYEDEGIQLYLDDKAMYDSVRFEINSKNSSFPYAASPVYSVMNGLVPVHSYFTIRLKPNSTILNADKVLMKRIWNGKSDIARAKKEGDWYEAKFREFGDFVLLTDEKAPTIGGGFANNANLSASRSITFTPKDDQGEITNFRAELDGKWLLFSNDKGANFIYIFDEHCPKGSGKHTLKITVEDLVGNKAEKTLSFTR